MNKYVAVQILGMVLLVVGAQGAIRLLADHTDGGLVRWVPGGFVGWLIADTAAVVVGVALVSWGQARARTRGPIS